MINRRDLIGIILIGLVTLVFILQGCATAPVSPVEPRDPKVQPIVGEDMPSLVGSPVPIAEDYLQSEDGRMITVNIWANTLVTSGPAYATFLVEGCNQWYQVFDIAQDVLYIDSDCDGVVNEIVDGADMRGRDDISPFYGLPAKGTSL